MNAKIVGFIHTTPSTIGMVESYMKSYLPHVEYIHIYNGNVKRANFSSPIGVTPKINLLRYATYAEELQSAGCCVIVSCCSLMPRATSYANIILDVPFIQLDSVVLDYAAKNYSRIGVINTTAYVVPYITEKLEMQALAQGKKIELIFSNSTSLLSLFNAGDFDNHDKLVLEDMQKLDDSGVDCILMGQIPFALMEEKIKTASFRAPVLYAGEFAFTHITKLLEEMD